MKKKLRILLEYEVIKKAKGRAAEEGWTLSDVIQDALVSYLSNNVPDPKIRKKAYQIFCERPIPLSREQLQGVLEGDAWH